MEVVASLSQGRTAAAQCGLFTHKSVPVIFEPPCSSNTVFFVCSFHKINTHTCAAFVGLLQKKTVIRVFRMAQFYTVSVMYLSSYNDTVLYSKYHVH